MGSFAELAAALGAAAAPGPLLWALFGVLIGTAIGILPGVGATAAIALLAPFAMTLEPLHGLALLLAVDYGAKYGGSTTSILLNIPGEASAVVACLDGHPLARAGRAGPAITIAALASFAAGILGLIALLLLLPAAGAIVRLIGPPEHLALVSVGLALVVILVGRSALRGALAVSLGLLLSFVGADIISGSTRLTFGRPELLDGIGIAPLAAGLFAVGEVLARFGRAEAPRPAAPRRLRQLVPDRAELAAAAPAAAQGSVIGFLVGVVPGAGATVASVLSYAFARRVSRRPERFGHGAIEGLAAPEAANNAASAGALVPFFALGIPGSSETAVLLGILSAWGLQAGPLALTEHGTLIWALIGTMFVGNVLLLAVNVPLAPVFARVLALPQWMLTGIVLVLAVVGVYAVDRDAFDVLLLAAFGLVGLLLRRADVPLAPLLLAFVLGPIAERDLRAALILSAGDPVSFFARPLAIVLFGVAVAAAAAPVVQRMRGRLA